MIRKIFISYSRKDEKIVRKLINILEENGIAYFIDKSNISWGESIKQRIQEGISDCDAVIVIATKHSINSKWVPLEIGFALGKERLILPFLMEISLADVPDYLLDLNYKKNFKEIEDFFRNMDKQDREKELRILRALFKEDAGRNLYNYRTAYYIPAITTYEGVEL